MELSQITEAGATFLEGQPGEAFIGGPGDARLLIEECLGQRVRSVLLYAANLPAPFFDLSSGQAGHILQALQNYQIRMAVVCPPGSVSLSSCFGELLAETQRGGAFGVFAERAGAVAWLAT